MNFLVCRVQQQKRLARAIDPEQPPGRLGAGQQLAIGLERQGNDVRRLGLVEGHAFAVWSDLVDDTFFASARIEVARRIKRKAPDVFVIWVEERCALSGAVDFVNTAVGRRGRVQRSVGCESERM